LSVADSGQGLGAFRAGKHGPFGLQGMREHAAQIGARRDIDDVAGGGTRVTLTLPAKLAAA
jgi:signal transduction histidine kinase